MEYLLTRVAANLMRQSCLSFSWAGLGKWATHGRGKVTKHRRKTDANLNNIIMHEMQSSSWITNNYMVTIKHVLFADLSVCLALEKTNVTRERDSCRDSETEMIRTGVRLKIIVLSDVTISGWGDRNKIRETDLGSIQLMQGLPDRALWASVCVIIDVSSCQCLLTDGD